MVVAQKGRACNVVHMGDAGLILSTHWSYARASQKLGCNPLTHAPSQVAPSHMYRTFNRASTVSSRCSDLSSHISPLQWINLMATSANCNRYTAQRCGSMWWTVGWLSAATLCPCSNNLHSLRRHRMLRTWLTNMPLQTVPLQPPWQHNSGLISRWRMCAQVLQTGFESPTHHAPRPRTSSVAITSSSFKPRSQLGRGCSKPGLLCVFIPLATSCARMRDNAACTRAIAFPVAHSASNGHQPHSNWAHTASPCLHSKSPGPAPGAVEGAYAADAPLPSSPPCGEHRGVLGPLYGPLPGSDLRPHPWLAMRLTLSRRHKFMHAPGRRACTLWQWMPARQNALAVQGRSRQCQRPQLQLAPQKVTWQRHCWLSDAARAAQTATPCLVAALQAQDVCWFFKTGNGRTVKLQGCIYARLD